MSENPTIPHVSTELTGVLSQLQTDLNKSFVFKT